MIVKTLSFRGIDISYRMTGKGPDVVLLHGFGEDGNVWKFQEAFLTPYFRLIIPDLPGSGRSPFLPMDGIPPEDIISGYADIIKKIAEKEAVRHCVLLGHSMGGYIALAFAAKYEDMLAGLGLVHSTAYADSGEKKEARSKGIAFIQKHGAQEFLKQSVPNLFGDDFKAARPEAVQELALVLADRGGTGEVLARLHTGDGTGPLLRLGSDFQIDGELAERIAAIDGIANVSLTARRGQNHLRLVA